MKAFELGNRNRFPLFNVYLQGYSELHFHDLILFYLTHVVRFKMLNTAVDVRELNTKIQMYLDTFILT